MRILTQLQAISAVAAITLFAACSGDSAIAPRPSSPQSLAYSSTGRAPKSPGLMDFLNINPQAAHRFKSFYSCPATGPIKYVSDQSGNNVINIYSGKFAGQAPCGRISSAALSSPVGLFVQVATHDLYVANRAAQNVLVFHRGAANPYNKYKDPTAQQILDVAVAKDGTIIASNAFQQNGNQNGSLSTWTPGPHGGTFVGNFPMTNDMEGFFVSVQSNGTVYYNDIDAGGKGAVWSLSCPAGACGPQTKVASIGVPGGMAVDSTGDLLMNDQGFLTADTFELPNPNPKTFPLSGQPLGVAINPLDHHYFVADGADSVAIEYSYPGGKLLGTVPVNPPGLPFGIAVDP